MTLAHQPNVGCSLEDLADRTRTLGVRVLTPPTDPPVLVGATAIEEPDAALPELPGGLLLLVGAREPYDVVASLRRAAASGFVGVVIKTRGRDYGPELDVAIQLRLAVIAISDDAAWKNAVALLDAALAPIAFERQPTLIAEGLFAIADAVAGVSGGSVAIEDLGQRVLAHSSLPGQPIDELRSQGILERRVPEVPGNKAMYREVLGGTNVVRYPAAGGELARAAIAIRAGNLPLGSIWVIENNAGLTDDGRHALEEGAQLAALHMLRARSMTEVDQHLRSQAFQSLLEGRGGDVTAHRLGLPVGLPQAVLAFGPRRADAHPGSPIIAHLAHHVAQRCHALRPDAIITSADRAVYTLISDTEPAEAALRLARALVPALERSVAARLCVGIGSDDHTAPRLARMREDADAVLRVLASWSAPLQVATLRDVRADVLLLQVHDELTRSPHLRQPAIDDIVADDPRRADLVESLSAWFDARFDVRRAATELHVHPNTLRYRLRRFADMTGLDLDDPGQCLALWLQLRSDHLFAGA